MKKITFPTETNRGSTGTPSRLAVLHEREKELRAQIASEQTRLARRRERDDARLYFIAVRALIENGEKSPEFRLMLSQVLNTSVTDERARRLLAARGWI
jgi:hypothetical protein